MERILAVGASPRKNGNTDHLIARAAEGVRSGGLEVEVVQLRDYSITPCVGCERCRKKYPCPKLMDGMQILYPKIFEARGLILASPTHNYNVTAWMKAFIDRLYCYYDFTPGHPRAYTSRLGGQGRKAAVMAVCEQLDPRDMGFTLEAMAMPLEALGYQVLSQLPVFGVFEAGRVAEFPDVLQAAEEAGRKLAGNLVRVSGRR